MRIFDEYESQQEARRLLSEIVAGRRPRYPEVDLRHELVVGHPVQAHRHLGPRAGPGGGHPGSRRITGMLLGSVSQGVLHHARCPVIAVPSAPA